MSSVVLGVFGEVRRLSWLRFAGVTAQADVDFYLRVVGVGAALVVDFVVGYEGARAAKLC